MSLDPPMTEDLANTVYDTLVNLAGASARGRDSFVHAQVRDDHTCIEFRFQGALGFGGKFWRNRSSNGQSWYVTCYREDETPARLSIIDRANDELAKIETTA